ncbi:MAG: hypothetical protein ACOX4I_06610 [Anaerovoracaceae bacterium]|jgi:hypothetical protein
MGKTLMGKVIYFWIFIIAGMFVSHLIGMPMEPRNIIILLVVLACFYWGLALVAAAGRKHREKKRKG